VGLERGPPNLVSTIDRLCGLVVRVPGYRSRGPGSILGATRFSVKLWVLNGSTQPCEYNWSPLWIQRSGIDSRRYQIFWEVVGLQRGPPSLVSI
jgi:hypothetical protein